MTRTVTLAAALLMAAPCLAKDGIVCVYQDNQGNRLGYAFGENTPGTLVETVFRKNGKVVFSEKGERPVWKATLSRPITFVPLASPDWKIHGHLRQRVVSSVQEQSHGRQGVVPGGW
jgi:hypothetical protein